jgi:uncharacterized membrane protein
MNLEEIQMRTSFSILATSVLLVLGSACLLALGLLLPSPAHAQNKTPDLLQRLATLLTPADAKPTSESARAPAPAVAGPGSPHQFVTADFPGANGSEAFGFADGTTVGVFAFAGPQNQSFTFHGGVYKVFSVPGATTTAALAINGNGQIAGGYRDSSNVAHGFVDTSGSFTTIDYPGAGGTLCFDINLLGHVAGSFTDAAFNQHGFTYDGSTFTSLDFPGGSQTEVNGINSAGEVVGSYVDASNVGHGFTYLGGVYTTLDPPGSTYTAAFGINDSSVISGTYNDSHFLTHGFLYSNGTFTTVDVHGASGGTILNHINNKNQFAGTFYDASGEDHAITGH